MANYTEPIVVQIVNDVGGAIGMGGGKSTGSASGTSTGSKGVGSAMGVIGGVTAIASVATELLGLVKEAVKGILSPLMTVVKVVLKLAAQFLRPAVDILLILLMPILTLLKPMVKIFNDIMRPFRQIAMRMIKDNPGNTGGAISVMLMGFSTALMNVVGQFLKTSISMWLGVIKNLILYPLADLLPWFDREGVDVAVAGVENMIASGIDTVLNSINKTTLDAAKNIGRLAGVAVDDIDFNSAMKKVAQRLQKSYNDALDAITSKRSNVEWTSPNGTQYGTYFQGGQGYSGVIPGTGPSVTTTKKNDSSYVDPAIIDLFRGTNTTKKQSGYTGYF